ncbi:MFS transporter [Staphylococcus pseudintermedius]|nr:MFS transporter [Staphylococcus pseudintermedius]
MTIMRTLTFMLSIFIVGMVEMVVAGIMNLMSADLNISEAGIGQLVTIYAFTFALTGPILVKLTEKYSPKSVLLSAIAFFVIGNLMIALSPNFTILIIGRIISSAAAALIVVKILSTTVVLARPENRGKMLGIVYTGFSASNVFGVPIGTLIGDWAGWRFTFGLIILVGLIAGVLLTIYLPKEVKSSLQTTQNHTSRILDKGEVTKLLSITFILLTANSVAYIYINPLILSGGHNIQFVSLALLIIGIAGMLGTSMGGIVKVEWIKEGANFLLATMVFFFVPSVIGLMDVVSELNLNFIIFFTLVAVGTVLVAYSSGLVAEKMVTGRIFRKGQNPS